MTSLSSRVRTLRRQLDMTQQELADLCGLKQSDISKIESGRIQATTAIASLAKSLRCDPYWLETGVGNQHESGWPFPHVDRALWDDLNETEKLLAEGEIRGVLRSAKQTEQGESFAHPSLPHKRAA